MNDQQKASLCYAAGTLHGLRFIIESDDVINAINFVHDHIASVLRENGVNIAQKEKELYTCENCANSPVSEKCSSCVRFSTPNSKPTEWVEKQM